MLETKYSVGNGKYIPFPAEALEGFRGASKAAILVLLTLSAELEKDPESVIDIEKLCSVTGYDRDDIEDALLYWKARGILRESDDCRSIICANLEIVLERGPTDYEAKRIINAVSSSGLDIGSAVRIIALSKYRTSAADRISWTESALREIGKLPSPAPQISALEKYYSLTEMIRMGFPITRKFTQAEKEIIHSWAQRRIPLNMIFNAYAISAPVARTVSFQHIDKLLEKMVIPEADDDKLGY